MAQDQMHNIAIIRHWFDTINENDPAKMLKEWGEVAAEDYLLHDPSTPDLKPGLADYLKLFEQQMAANTDRKLTVEGIFAVDDKVINHGTYEFVDVATQTRNKVAYIAISRFEDGKVKEEWQVGMPFAVQSNK